jgi:cyclohexadieny/prephenate dehydrogenase
MTRRRDMQLQTLAIVGVGLIGGSVGLAVRRCSGGTRIIGVDGDSAALLCAKERGIVDEIATDVRSATAAADMVLFCTPVDSLAGQVLSAAAGARPGTVLTDAGSTKSTIVNSVEQRIPSEVWFVGGHPLAGSEKQGPRHADAELFRDRVVVLTPTAQTNEQAITRVTGFWQLLGARVLRMSPEAHDRAMAATSHLPHLVASALAGVLPLELIGLAASGFRDTTRIAAGDPALWSAILDANRDETLAALTRFEDRLKAFRLAIATGDREAVRNLLAAGRELRTAIKGDR